MTVLITGGHGYLGWPTALRVADETDERVVIADNGARAQWVDAAGGVTVGRDASRTTDHGRGRVLGASLNGFQNLDDVHVDLTDRNAVDRLLAAYEPDVVIHAAAQPSAPYSQLDGRRALETQLNNVASTVNLLWGLREAGLEGSHVIATTTTGIYGAPSFTIPEGHLAGASPGECGWIEDLPFPNLGGSWYHVTKGFDAANLRLAHQQWGQPISDVRTSIVYGATTEETRAAERGTRLDIDYYFGTVVHRFCAQAVAGYPITVYGKGEQRKPFIALEDAVEGLARLAATPVVDYEVYNQVARAVPIVELAETVAEAAADFGFPTEVEHVENPRDEDEEHAMEIDNDRYTELVGGEFEPLADGIAEAFTRMVSYAEEIEASTDRFLPDALQEGS